MTYTKIFLKTAATSLTLFLCQAAYSGTMGTEPPSSGHIYVGAFGGGGALMKTNLSQFGTAYFIETLGGPLAVNAFGKSNTPSNWLVGGHVGYQFPQHIMNLGHSTLNLTPATELEGYYIGGATIEAYDKNNDTTRLDEHLFHLKYPMQTGVFLINAILNVNHPQWEKVSSYVGVGIGSALVKISNAQSTQTSPQELGINHYNSNPTDTTTAFAAQPKIGLKYAFSQNLNLFAEYRFLYLSSTDYTFGSTVYPTHVATSDWDVKMGSQYYNMGTVGLQYDL